VFCNLVILGPCDPETTDALTANGIDFEVLGSLSLEALVEQYELADLVSFVSTHEGFGMPILEANAVGRPVICGNTTSMPEVAGDAACIVDPYDVGAIRAGIERIITDDAYREELVLRGLENVNRFDPDLISRQYLEIYRWIAAGRQM
jgi:glycosyltransferase involved in cell wall biosynthesis